MGDVDVPKSFKNTIPDCEQLYASFAIPLKRALLSLDFPDHSSEESDYIEFFLQAMIADQPISSWVFYSTAFYEYMDWAQFSSSSSLLSLALGKSKSTVEKALTEIKNQEDPLVSKVRNALGQGLYIWTPLNLLKEDLYENYRKQKCAWIAALIDDSFAYEDLYALAYELIISNAHLRCLERLIKAFPVLAFVHDASRRSLLHWAALSGNAMAVSFLVRIGADYCLDDSLGYSPLDYAKLQNNWQVSQFLRVLTEAYCSKAKHLGGSVKEELSFEHKSL